MRIPTIATLALLTTAALAGCLAGDDGAPTGDGDGVTSTFHPEWAEHAVPFGEDHDHFDPAQHQNLSTPNFEVLGWNPLVSDHYGATAGGHLCGDATDAGDRRLAAVHSLQGDVAFVLVDVTDPAAPTVLGEFVTPMSGSRDIAITADGRHVVIAGTGPKQAEEGGPVDADVPTAIWRDACGGSYEVPVNAAGFEGPLPPGAILVNIEDPDNMAIDSIFPVPTPLGVHSIYAGEAGGQDLVIVSVVNLVAPASNFYFLDIVDTPAGTQLVYLSEYQDTPLDGNGALINGHNDGWFQLHPVTNTPLVYLANWHQGMVILDFTIPQAPVVEGRWTDNEGPSQDLVQDGIGNYHEAFPLDTTWDGKHYTFVGQEILAHPSETASGWVHVIDTTDPANPKKVSGWTLPVDVQWDASLVFSTHYVDIFEKTLFVAHYHAGVWAVDLTDVGNATILPSIGAFVPANVSPEPPRDRSYDWTPTVMDANVLDNGDIVVWDATSGVYTVRFDASNPAPPMTFEGLSESS